MVEWDKKKKAKDWRSQKSHGDNCKEIKVLEMKLQTKQSQIWEVDIGGGGGEARYLFGWLFFGGKGDLNLILIQ